jgi:hypothetical protein
MKPAGILPDIFYKSKKFLKNKGKTDCSNERQAYDEGVGPLSF